MKKIKQILLLLVTLTCICTFMPYTAHAYDEGYYIKNMDVQVVANSKREFKITETLKVYFNEERHGIIRRIPKTGSLEDYKITDVSVNKDPYEQEDGDELELKIGDEDETIEGDKTYVINYTLKFYDDEQPDADYIYLNVLGTQWDTYIKNFTTTITYPQDATLQNVKITDGQYGSKDSSYVDYTTNNNQINISSKREIPPNCGVTINAKLSQGAFKDAPVKQYPYLIKSDISNIKITEEKKYLVDREYIVQVNENTDSEDVNYLHLWQNEKKDYIRNLNIKNNNKITFNDNENAIALPNKKGIYKFNLIYEVEPPLSSDIKIYLNNPHNAGKTEKLQAKITSPYNMEDNFVSFKQKGVNIGTNRYTYENDEKTINFRNENNINVGENVSVNIKIDKALFSRPTPIMYYISIIVSVAVLVILIYLYRKYKDKEVLVSAVEFYPPENLNSAELAYAYKQRINNRDIVSLLYYWASHNHIKVTINKDDSFKLTKTSELDNEHKSYEKSLFNEILRGKTVTDKELEDRTINNINYSRDDIKEYFTGEKELVEKESVKKARKVGFLPMLSIITAFIYEGILGHDLVFSLFISLILVIVIFVFTTFFISYAKDNTKNRLVESQRNKGRFLKIFLSIIYLLIALLFLIFTELPAEIILINLVILVEGITFSGLIPTRSSYGKDILGKIEGFRNFIQVAEKERLEALLEEDPYYFYNTLPYAQVLGVTEIWIDKFDGISMCEPEYYDTYYPMRDIYYMNMFNKSLDSVTSSVSQAAYTPSSSSDGFSGGGFSGGGGGGGGGSSW